MRLGLQEGLCEPRGQSAKEWKGYKGRLEGSQDDTERNQPMTWRQLRATTEWFVYGSQAPQKAHRQPEGLKGPPKEVRVVKVGEVKVENVYVGEVVVCV